MSDSRVRRLALVGPLAGERRARHTAGFPLDLSKMLPVADVVLLVADDDGPGAMLFRYTAHGEFGGDTWHPTMSDAEAAADDEYGTALGAWEELPADVVDPHTHAVRYANERLDSRGDW